MKSLIQINITKAWQISEAFISKPKNRCRMKLKHIFSLFSEQGQLESPVVQWWTLCKSHLLRLYFDVFQPSVSHPIWYWLYYIITIFTTCIHCQKIIGEENIYVHMHCITLCFLSDQWCNWEHVQLGFLHAAHCRRVLLHAQPCPWRSQWVSSYQLSSSPSMSLAARETSFSYYIHRDVV